MPVSGLDRFRPRSMPLCCSRADPKRRSTSTWTRNSFITLVRVVRFSTALHDTSSAYLSHCDTTRFTRQMEHSDPYTNGTNLTIRTKMIAIRINPHSVRQPPLPQIRGRHNEANRPSATASSGGEKRAKTMRPSIMALYQRSVLSA